MSYYPGQAKTSRHIAYVIVFIVGIGLTVGLYYVKTRAQSARADVTRLERLVAAEQVALNVLKAEMAYLESPERVSRLAASELGLKPVAGEQIIDVESIDERFELVQADSRVPDEGARDEN